MKINCLICKNNKTKTIYWADYEIFKCENCELLFCKEMKEKEEEGDSSPVDEDGIKMMANSFFKTKEIANNYFKKRVLYYEKMLNRKCESILEIGCGPGVFYEPANNHSIRWKGLEINPFWIDFGNDNEIPISREKINQINEEFDVISAHQVLEHVEDPSIFMKEILEKLKPGGILHFELPNQLSLTSKLRQISPFFSYDFGFIQPPMHMRAYSKKTIDFLFKNHKLEIKKILVCANNNNIWGQVRNYTILQKILYLITGLFGLGSLLIGIAKKDEL